MSRAAMHTWEEHTSEVELHLRAPDLRELLCEAGRALAELLGGGGPRGPATSPPEAVRVRASDRETLLVDWLNELVYRSETRKRIYDVFELLEVTEQGLQGFIRGSEAGDLATQVKAATLHGLRVEDVPGGLRAVVVLDV